MVKSMGELAQGVKVHAAKPNNLSSNTRTHMEGEKRPDAHNCPLTSTYPTWHVCAHKKKMIFS